MKVQATAFVVQQSYENSMLSLNDYRLVIVVEKNSVTAAVSGDIPLRAFRGSEVDLALYRALIERTPVYVTVDIPVEAEEK